jgi:hypothetical protein
MKYRNLHKWHIWLGWLVGVPLILWTASGLFMAARPMAEVRGEHLRAAPTAIAPFRAVAPVFGSRPIERLVLEQRVTGPVWLIRYRDGSEGRADPKTGEILPKPTSGEIRALAKGYYTGDSQITAVRLFSADKEPLELRRGRPAWRVSLADRTNLYLDAESGSLLAVRTPQWRIFDFMWGLHVMDLQTREDTNHPILIGFAGISLLSLLMAFWLLIARKRRRSANSKA